MRRSGVRIPLAPPQADIRSGCRFLYAWRGVAVPVAVVLCRRWCSGRRIVCLWAWPLCVLVGGGPPARSPHASLTARSGRSRGPPWPCRRPPAPRPGPPVPPAPFTPAAPARCIVSTSGQAPPPLTGTAARALQALRCPSHLWAGALACARRVVSKPGRTAVAGGDSRETVIAFAGVRFVSGETDDTIASQIHPFLVLFHRAKASWVSYRRPEIPALVLTVTCCGAVSSMGATKFAQRRLSMAIARQHSPSAGRMAQNECFIACWASCFAEMAHTTSCWASFLRPAAP